MFAELISSIPIVVDLLGDGPVSPSGAVSTPVSDAVEEYKRTQQVIQAEQQLGESMEKIVQLKEFTYNLPQKFEPWWLNPDLPPMPKLDINIKTPIPEEYKFQGSFK